MVTITQRHQLPQTKLAATLVRDAVRRLDAAVDDLGQLLDHEDLNCLGATEAIFMAAVLRDVIKELDKRERQLQALRGEPVALGNVVSLHRDALT